MSTVSGVSTLSGSSSTTNPKATLGKDDFLRILITQLQNQDPMEPLKDREFIAQMAQFSTVEQIGNMAQYQKLTYESMNGLASSVGLLSGSIGKAVEWVDVSGKQRTGMVDAIRMSQGVAYAESNGSLIPLDQIIRIGNSL